MSTAIAINKQQIVLKTYHDVPVVTFSDIDAVHQRPEGTARKRFNDNKKRFVQGEDFFKVSASEIRTHKIMEISEKAREDVTLITESGYLMLCKSFTDDLSWAVQRQLVDCYFHRNAEEEEPPYAYYDKTYRGVPVLTTIDFEHFTGISKSAVNWCLRHHGKLGEDYMQAVTFEERCQFRKENPRFRKNFNALNLITRSGVELLCAAFGIQFDPPEGLNTVQLTWAEQNEENNSMAEKVKKYILILGNMLEKYRDGYDCVERDAYKKLMYLTVCDLTTYISYLGGKSEQVTIDDQNRKMYYRMDEEDKHYIFGLMKSLLSAEKYYK